MKTSTITISILVATVLIGGAIMLAAGNNDSNNTGSQAANNVSVVDGKQIIAISAKGGYSPKVTTAKAGMPTAIKIDTRGTFDCSSALTIPTLGYSNNLPPSGETLIDVPPQEIGTTMKGLCSMGMYSFTVNFN
ncbi:MAG: cupredoxin domain-containing protein [bacterium]|nr:cupredoxin domain-containing protein [bacterium]